MTLLDDVKELGKDIVIRAKQAQQKQFDAVADVVNQGWLDAVHDLIDDEDLRDRIESLTYLNIIEAAEKKIDAAQAQELFLNDLLAGKIDLDKAGDLLKKLAGTKDQLNVQSIKKFFNDL